MNPQDVNAAPPSVTPSATGKKARRSFWGGGLVALVLLGLVGAAAWHLVRRAHDDQGRDRGPGGRPNVIVTVGQATVRKAELPVIIDALGTVIPATTVTLRPQVSGLLTQVLFTEGQMVSKGQLLARIDPRPFEQTLLQARGNRLRDEAQLEHARVMLERYRTLLAQDAIARQDVDAQAALVKQLEGTVLTDRAQEDMAQLNLDYTRITAPVAGRIGLRMVDAGNLVTSGASGGLGASGDAAGIATITRLAPIDAQFSVPQDRVGDIRAAQGDSAALVVTALDRTRQTVLGKGRFATLDNLVDTATGTVKAKARFDNAGAALFPNQFVNVQLLLRHVAALVVPVTAVRTGPNGDYVYVIDQERKVSLRKVRRGQASVELMAITEGLAEGERVVTEGGDRLQDGMVVQLPGTKDGPRPHRPPRNP